MRFKDVKRIIDEWDPMGLLGIGCPPDEYDIESKEIWETAQYSTDIDFVSTFIYKYLHKMFGEHCQTLEACKIIANKISKLEGERITLKFFCPLLRREITEDYCSDLIMVALGCTKMSVENKDPFDIDVAISICKNCENYYWDYDEYIYWDDP